MLQMRTTGAMSEHFTAYMHARSVFRASHDEGVEVRVLSIDGGGIRGVIPATILMAIEQRAGKAIHELFDLIVGTSTGGILAIALTCPTPTGKPATAEEVRSLYLDHGESIFPLGNVPMVGSPAPGNLLFGTRTPLPPAATFSQRMAHFMGTENIRKLAAPTGGAGSQANARYPATGLENQLEQRFGDQRMSRAVLPIGVVSVDFDTEAPLVFWGGGIVGPVTGDAHMKHAARATSAAPTFFAPLPYRTVQNAIVRCVDGGLIANDPAFVGYTAAMGILKARNRAEEGVALVSIGTGLTAQGESLEDHDARALGDSRTWGELVPSLLRAFTIGPGALIRSQLELALGESYIRLQTILTGDVSPAMDDASPQHVRQLVDAADGFVRSNEERIGQLVGVLTDG